MHISLEKTGIGAGLGAAVPALDLELGGDIPLVIAVETDERPMLVSLLIGGRLRPDTGRMLVDGHENLDELRRRSALVDTPIVAEASAGIALGTIVAEEFSFAGLPTSRRAVQAFLAEHGLAAYETLAFRALPPTERIRLFSELAVLRPGVAAIVITSPERHGAAPDSWYPVVEEIAARGIMVAIVTDAVTSAQLLALGARDGHAVTPPERPVLMEQPELIQPSELILPSELIEQPELSTEAAKPTPANERGLPAESTPIPTPES